MKPQLGLLALAMLSAISVPAATVIDTSILKAGNTWVYERREENRSAGSLQSGYSGTIRLTIDSLIVVNDTVKFRVMRRDSGQTLVTAVGTDPTTITTQTTLYTFHAGVYSPSTPLFAANQTFAANSPPNVEYRGDTLRYNHLTTGGGCLVAAIINLERVGLIEDSETWGGCGNTSGIDSYRLLSLNGFAYVRDSVHAVAIRSAVKQNLKSAPTSRLHKNFVMFEAQGKQVDTKGRKLPRSLQPAK